MIKFALSLLTIGCLLALTAAPASIGIVKSTGQFRVNGSAIPGNSNLFEGDVVETAGGRSIVQIGATQFTLLPESRAHIFHDRTVLEKGSGLLTGPQNHTVEAATLRIASVTKNSVIQVEVSAPNRISVATRQGGAEVRNSSGVLVASMRSGTALAFDADPQSAGASTALKITGTLESLDGKFFLTDTTTNVKFELQGTDLAKYAGKQVEIAGSSIPGVTAAAGASQVCQVVTIKPASNKKKAAGAAGAAGAGTAGAGGAAGISAATTAVIVGGVVVGGVLVGLAAAGTFSGGAPVSNQ
jgi:hypothetical protein